MRQKRKLLVWIILAIITAAALIPQLRTNVTAQPGDANDPLVTRRYVDERINALWAENVSLRNELNQLRALVEAGGTPGVPHQPGINLDLVTDTIMREVMLYFEAMYGDMLRVASEGTRLVPFTPMYVEAGRTMVIEGGTEMILRSGQAVVVSGPNGLVDLTAGRDIVNGQPVQQNHMMLAPISDGRGFHFVTNAWIMIRGDFHFTN